MELHLPNESYLEGLRNNDPNVLEAIFAAGREPTVAAIHAMGGTQADGELMLQVGILEMAFATRQTGLPDGVSFLSQLKILALAHYADWRVERDLVPENEKFAFSTPELGVPNSDQLRSTRRYFVAWSKYARLGTDCQATLRSELSWDFYRQPGTGQEHTSSEKFQDCVARYRELLGPSATEGTLQNGLPLWATTAIMDEKGYALWQNIQTAARTVVTQQLETRQRTQNRRNWSIVAVIVGIVLISWLYSWSTRPPAAIVYQDNFAPPESMIADMQARYSNLALDDSITVHTADCERMFETADNYYQQKQYGQSAMELEGLLEDEQFACQSDALFYLGLLALQMDQPDYTLACFAKIEDLEHFGEDIYWYQAMAFVKIAEKNPTKKDLAVRALERAISNTQDSPRRGQAERMLDKLKH